MIINRNKTVMENLVDLIKESNQGLTISPGQFSVVSINADTAGADNNTRIGIVATANAGFKGTLDLWYKRATLTQGLVSPITQLQRNAGETNAQVGARILTALNIKDSEVTINGGSGWGGDGVQTIASISDSLIYLPGQSYQVTVEPTGILGSITFNSTYVDQTIKTASYRWGFQTNSAGSFTFGSWISQTGFTPASPSPFGFSLDFDGFTNTYGVHMTHASGGISQTPLVARVYDSNNNLIRTFTGGNRSTETSVRFNAGGWTNLPVGVVLRVDFSLA